MTEIELDEIMTLHWPLVLRRVMADGSDDWLKGFVRSIARQAKRVTWRPSRRQAEIMRRLVAEVGAPAEEKMELIER